MEVIRCENLGKAFPLGKRQPSEVLKHQLVGGGTHYDETFWALRDFNLSVNSGEAIGVIGRNGSGKSTLLQLIAGLYPPSEGSIRIKGKAAALLELGSGFDSEYTGRQNVYMNAALLGLDKSQVDERFDSIAAFADIGPFIDQQVRTYSSGMFVRLAFSVAIHVDAEILIVDEALAVGDARFAAKCMKRIARMREDGMTLFFVSHDVGAVRTLCDRAVWLHGGRTKALGSVPRVTSSYMEYMFGEELDDPQEIAEQPVESVEDVRVVKAGGLELDIKTALAHWGRYPGTILAATLRSEAGGQRVFQYGDEMVLSIRFRVPAGIDTEHLSVAFSLKNLAGIDLMVCTMMDENRGLLTGAHGEMEVSFGFPMRLTHGKYMLVIALEDRSNPAQIEYYEYIEGAMFFEVASKNLRFGIFNIPTEISIRNIND